MAIESKSLRIAVIIGLCMEKNMGTSYNPPEPTVKLEVLRFPRRGNCCLKTLDFEKAISYQAMAASNNYSDSARLKA